LHRGAIFAALMMALMLGSSLYSLKAKHKEKNTLTNDRGLFDRSRPVNGLLK